MTHWSCQIELITDQLGEVTYAGKNGLHRSKFLKKNEESRLRTQGQDLAWREEPFLRDNGEEMGRDAEENVDNREEDRWRGWQIRGESSVRRGVWERTWGIQGSSGQLLPSGVRTALNRAKAACVDLAILQALHLPTGRWQVEASALSVPASCQQLAMFICSA